MDLIIDDIIESLTPQKRQFELPEYNDYYKKNSIEHVKKRLKITTDDDPLINLIVEKEAERMNKTPLEEWNEKKFKSNNNIACVFRNGFKNGYTYSA